MSQVGALLVGSYDYRLVALSIFIAISASYAALDLGGRVTAARGRIRWAWLGGGATAMGLGIWSMHFTAMLAFILPVSVAYHWPTVLLSLLAAILASAVALHVVSQERMGHAQTWAGSVFMGLGIAGMHYIGMAAMRLSALCLYSPILVAVSILIAIVAARAALFLTFGHREHFRGTTLAKVGSATVMGSAIFLMHYTGMSAARFIPSIVPPDMSHVLSISTIGIGGIAAGILVVQGLAILTSGMDRGFALQAQETNERFQQMADNIQEIFWTLDPDTKKATYASPAFEQIFELPLDSLYSNPTSYLEIVHPEDRQRVTAGLENLKDTNHFDEEFRIVCPSGTVKWLRCNGFVAKNSDGKVLTLLGSAQDITARKVMEIQLRENEDHYRDLVEHSTDLICTYNLHGRLLSLNELPAKLLGYSREELLNTPLRNLLLPEARSQFDDSLLTIQRDGFVKGRMVVLTKTGERRIWEYHNTLRTDGMTVPIVRGMAHDITDRKLLERALRLSEEKFKKAFHLSPVEIVITTLEDDLFIDVNSAFERNSGFTREEVLGHTSIELGMWINPDDRAPLIEDIGKHGALQNREISFRTKSGNTRVTLCSAEQIKIGDRQCLLTVAQDITERKRAEDDLHRVSEQALHMQEEERRRISRDLHDSTGQNLVALATMLGQLRSSAPSIERKSRALLSECLGLVEQSIREVRTLSYALYPPELDESGLEQALRDYLDGFSKRSGIRVELEISPHVGQLERDIELALFRVVQESLTNIQRHSGSKLAMVRIDRNSDLTLEIRDLGRNASAGIEGGKEVPRFKVGVGILSMQERVKLVGGRLDLESTSHGTTVRVTVPLGGKEREKTAHSGR
jgi:PAS domain S-box-containing protein